MKCSLHKSSFDISTHYLPLIFQQVTGQTEIIAIVQSWFSALPDITFKLHDTFCRYDQMTNKHIVKTNYLSTFTNAIDYVMPDVKAYMSNYKKAHLTNIDTGDDTATATGAVGTAAAADLHTSTTVNASSSVTTTAAAAVDSTFQGNAVDSLHLHSDKFASFIDDSDDLYSLLELLADDSFVNSATDACNIVVNNNKITEDQTKTKTENVNTNEKIPFQFTKNTLYDYSGVFSIHLNKDNKIENFVLFFKIIGMKHIIKRKVL